MDAKFWNDVYKTAKPWIIGTIVLASIISSLCFPKDFFPILRFFESIIDILLNKLDLLFPCVYISLGLKLWNPIKYPFKWSKTFGIFFLLLALINFASYFKSILFS